MFKTQFVLSHKGVEGTNEWKGDVLRLLYENQLLRYFSRFYEYGDITAAYIVAPERSFERFMNKYELKVEHEVNSIKFVIGEMYI